jgi:putative tryptophan/tyrosine transport system substrate-binding protein
MRRREFITLLGGAAAWPLVASAQQPTGMRRIGVLLNFSADDPEAQAQKLAFVQSLQQSGWNDGRDVRIETRWTEGDAARTRKYATELVELEPDVILAEGTTVLASLLQATRRVPIVFLQVTDPVGGGFVASLARPDGNATGFTQFEYSMREIARTAQGDSAECCTRSSPSQSHHIFGDRPVWRNPIRGAVARGGTASDRRA